MGDELRGDSLVHLNVRFSTEAELKQTLDFLYEKSKEGIAFTGLVEAMVNEVTIITAIHNIKSNKGSKTAGVDRLKMDKYLQMPKEELIALIRDNFSNYRPRPARRVYIPKKNGKQRPLGIPTVLDRIIQASEITKDDFVLEIGPGIGTMTQYLADSAREVTAVEIDDALIPILKDTLKEWDNVNVIHGDILKTDIRKIADEKNQGRPIKVWQTCRITLRRRSLWDCLKVMFR